MSLIYIETDRTFLRPLVPGDAADLYALNQDKEALRYTGDNPFKDVAEAELFLAGYDQYRRFGTGRLAVIFRESNTFIGWCGLKYTESVDEYDIGFRFLRRYWNQGFASETALACIGWGFEHIGMDRIVGRARTENIASVRVLQKIGLVFKAPVDFDGHEGLLLEITRSMYESNPLYR